MIRILIELGFNIAIAVVFYFFGASLPTCWFTFLFLCLFAGGRELSDQLWDIQSKLEDRLKNIQSKLDVIEQSLEQHHNDRQQSSGDEFS
jgi:hypothetical protein